MLNRIEYKVQGSVLACTVLAAGVHARVRVDYTSSSHATLSKDVARVMRDIFNAKGGARTRWRRSMHVAVFI